MKQVHATYSFVASTKTITLTGLNIDQDQLLLIVNATRGVQYFNFADSSLRATVTPGTNTTVVLTDASTTGHANGDALVIYYDDQVTSQVVSGTVTANPGTGAFTVSGTVGLDNASLVALENITVTVGAAVSVSNFPSTQTIAGTVTASNLPVITDGQGDSPLTGIQIGFYDAAADAQKIVREDQPLPVSIDSVLSISGAVTANVPNAETFILPFGSGGFGDALESYDEGLPGVCVAVHVKDIEGNVFGNTAFPISGTVTANNPNGDLTTRFGSVATANLAFITSAVTNTSRKYLLAQNISAGTVTIGIGFSPTTTQGIQLTAGGGLTFDAFCPTGAVYWLGAVTGANYCLIEG